MPLWSRQESCALSSPFPIAAILLSSYPFLISGMLLCWWITDVVQPLDMVNTEIKNGVMMLQLDWWGFGSSFLLAAWSLTPWAGAISSSFGIASFVDYEEMSCWCRSWVDFFFFKFMISSSKSTASEIPYLALTSLGHRRIFLPFISSTGYCTPYLTLT